MKKAIFGGTFDPIHNGHMHLAYEALSTLNLDKVIFVPSGNPPHKSNKVLTESSVRYELVKIAIEKEPKFELSDFEIRKRAYSYTYETMEFFKSIEPDTKWYFISGADCLRDLDMWKNVDKIMLACTLVVFNRPGLLRDEILEQKHKMELLYKKEIIFLEPVMMDISSSKIRDLIKKGNDVDTFIPSGVNHKIIETMLYK